MDETIGVKGGKNDRRRQMQISAKEKKRLIKHEEERRIAELEQKVKKQQIYTLIKTLPIVIGGGTIKVLHDTAVGKKRDLEEENSKWRIKEYDQDITHLTKEEAEEEKKRKKIVVLPTGEKVVVYVREVEPDNKDETLTEHDKAKEEIVIDKTPAKVVGVVDDAKKSNVTSTPVSGDDVEILDDVPVTIVSRVKGSRPVAIKPAGVAVQTVEDFIDNELDAIDVSDLSPKAKETLDRLKSRKIVEEYEKQLKDIRYELRKVIYEYNVLVDENEEVVLSSDAVAVLDRLSDIISKIEELKRRIKIDDLDKYDDNYIYVLIEDYLKDFHDKRIVDEVKDSPLYVLIEEKLDELEKKKDTILRDVEDKKDRLEDKEEDFERLKNRYYTVEQLNNQLLEFQYDQARLLKEIQEKVRNATSETERVETEFVGLTNQSRALLRLISFQMFLPGPRFAKGLAANAAAYLYFMNNIINPNTRTRRFRVITVTDYHSEIRGYIDQLDDSIRLLDKTSTQIDRMIYEVYDKYRDYIGVVPECSVLLQNLEKIKSEVEEKEEEMKKLKKQQELELEKNDAKVKTMGEYPVN